MRRFKTGATRDSDEGKNDYEGFISPFFIESFGNYMTKHRKQADGKLRDSDNWQKGMNQSVYLKSLLRHTLDLWFLLRGYKRFDKRDKHELTISEVCNAIFFNVQGVAHEEAKKDTKKYRKRGK